MHGRSVALTAAACATLALNGCGIGRPSEGTNGPLVSESGGGGGEVCAPVDEAGHASFAWESVRNESSDDVTVTDVSLTGSRVKVADWVLTDKDWPGGVRGRELPDPGAARLSTTIAGKKNALIAFTVRADDLSAGETSRVDVRYTSADGDERLRLAFRVRVVPAGQSCGE
jgi:hypothetical protein